MNLEQTVFFGIAKAVRKEQDKRENLNEYYAKRNMNVKPQSTNSYIHVAMDDVIVMTDNGKMSMNQIYAIAYKLQEKGLIQIHKGYAGRNKGRTTGISLETKGIHYIKSLKK